MEFLTHLPVLTNLALTLMLTLLLPQLMERLHLPGPIGYILAGLILGPNILAILSPDGKVVNFFADLGKLLLMFFAGFEIDVDQFKRARHKAATFGLLTFASPFLLAVALSISLGYPPVACAVIGAVLASHTLLGLPILKKYDLMGSEPVVATVGATVFTDMLAILVLAICLPIHVGGVDATAVAIQLVWLAVYVPGILFGLSAIVKWLLGVLGTTKAARTTIILLAIAVAAQIAEWIGMEGIIGAFLAGMALSESVEGTDMPHQAEAVTEFLLPFFLTNIGMQLKLEAFLNRGVIALALAVTLLAVISKLIGCGLAVFSMGKKKAMQIGMGMVPRGEVGIVVAQIGLGLGVISDAVFGVVLFMAVATTLIAPPFLVQLFKGEKRVDAEEVFPISQIS